MSEDIQEIIKEGVKTAVQAEIVKALGGDSAFLQSVITDELSRKVDSFGRVSDYAYHNTLTKLEFHVQEAIRRFTNECVATILEEKKDIFIAQLEKALFSSDVSKGIASSVFQQLLSRCDGRWGLEVVFKETKEGDE